ncbi:hypothetical protein FDH38_gp049 [Dinoroseobacter phage vB_DshS-R5C]|uniref:Uncharacterized protein n=1 Tax=Dinoroseobacter phage vB_DshS-R5C TaxID=1965368 RepID=A0A1V0DY76_9CAUD|nr:hypothetical protein FDH38_gp049 [Dinoroseobacter phage vB_DshS-R5C]ARB06103.1 hypothetical protein vBDshSR5C_49 [Dinoroseobacter phage vB_DshS-R5C]
MTTFNNIKAAFDPIREEAKAMFLKRAHAKIDALRDEEGTIRGYHFRDYRIHAFASGYITWADNRVAPGCEGVVNVERLEKHAQDFADAQVDSFIAKLEGKIGHLTDCVLNLRGNGEFTIRGMQGDAQVVVDQQVVFKVSSKGTFFLQWPARIYVDGKFTPEKKFKEMQAA